MKTLFITFYCSCALLQLTKGTLFPFSDLSIPEIYLPNQWNSITDCPMRYYDVGYSGFVAPLFGTPAYEKEFAHMAAIGWIDANGEINWNCGGSLISPNFVLTAAHCGFWRDKKPDVVRMGDLDLATTNGDKTAQQLSIVDVILHPSYSSRYRYHDIALLKLNASVQLHPTVCPACLWVNSTVDFKSVEACGYGQTGVFEEKTPILLKVTLSPVNTSACSEHHPPDRKLNKGLQESQICAVDPEFKQDTCLGDSGGPLQVKLLGFARLNPFIIGLTSFGKSCGTETPGVYTRVSSYIDWIEEITKEDFNPIKCALKYSHLREYEPDVVSSKSGDTEYIDSTKAHFDTSGTSYGHRGVTEPGNCGVIFIHEEYVLTTASCISNVKPEFIVGMKNSQPISFGAYPPIIHPMYKKESTNHDIALIKLKSPAEFDLHGVLPACLWSKELPIEQLEVTGFGLKQAQTLNPSEKESELVNDISYMKVRSSEIPIKECRSFYQEKGVQVSDQNICYGNVSWHILPDTCSLDVGGALGRKYNPGAPRKYFSYVMGLNIFGNDCGFGYPVVATKVSKYIDWIDSIIIGDKKGLGQDCESPLGPGYCKFSSDCSAVVSAVKSGASLNKFICDFKDHKNPLVCCPKQKSVLDDCPTKYLEFRKKVAKNSWDSKIAAKAHFVDIKREDETVAYGALISENLVIAPTNHIGKLPLTVEVGNPDCTNLPTSEVEKIEVISPTTSLLILKKKQSFSQCVVPICIWTNQEKHPFDLGAIPDLTKLNVPYQQEKCKKVIKNVDSAKFGCAVQEFSDCEEDEIQVPLQAIRNESGLVIPYLVGMGTEFLHEDCEETQWTFYYEKISLIVESILKYF